MTETNQSTTEETRELEPWSRADADGYYWWRYDRSYTPEVVEVRGGEFYSVAEPDPTSASVGEFLGPITPALTEEVTRLREALVQAVIPYEGILCDAESRRWIAPKVWSAIEDAVVAARAALQPTSEGDQEK